MIDGRIKLILVDDHQIILDGLRFLFSSFKNFQIEAAFTDSRKVLPYLEAHGEVDIVIADLNMPHLTGIDLVILLKKKFPTIKVLLLTLSEDIGHIKEAFKAGVYGYVLKKADKSELEKAIEQLMEGQKYISEDMIEELTSNTSVPPKPLESESIRHLTAREREVLKLILDEKSTIEIADILSISIPTVETHRRSLMIKLNAKNVVGLAKYAIKYGLV
ncbi:response regulator transcription factor [Runella sp. MFBS21]|uniref:response regulator n=1 Tax=Runella sp. MFBS21 TaxID=3034018 RepID=UPI0023F96128|nr:response regulator transcription factor [Runella sp. MFBS21]MDF7818559.1 response regulator transcription factor [Runella sp. MFBS21]